MGLARAKASQDHKLVIRPPTAEEEEERRGLDGEDKEN